MTPNMVITLIVVAVVIAAVAVFFLFDRRFVDGFKTGMHRSKLEKLARKQQRLTVARQKIKAKAKAVQDQREALEKGAKNG